MSLLLLATWMVLVLLRRHASGHLDWRTARDLDHVMMNALQIWLGFTAVITRGVSGLGWVAAILFTTCYAVTYRRATTRSPRLATLVVGGSLAAVVWCSFQTPACGIHCLRLINNVG